MVTKRDKAIYLNSHIARYRGEERLKEYLNIFKLLSAFLSFK